MRYLLLLVLLLACIGPAPAEPSIFELARRLGPGLNLDNALEAPREGSWGLLLEEDYFEQVRAAGFASVRLPVSWTHHARRHPPYTVDPAFFARVDWAVAQAQQERLVLLTADRRLARYGGWVRLI